jgi:hypothetical protein
MKAWIIRTIAALSLPLVAGCPDDTTNATGDDGSTGDATTAGPTTVNPTADDSSGNVTTPATTTSAETSSGVTDTITTMDTATTDPPPPPTCGNNVIEGDEVCDLTQINGETCQSLGSEGGVLGCLLDCSDYNLLGCFICGNDVIDMAEDCEGDVPDEVDCESLGFEAGTVACGDDCLWDTSDCSICGDGIRSGPEQCDGLDFDGATCQSVGFDSGFLACNLAACAFNYSACSGGMFVQDFEGLVAMPPEFTVQAFDPWFVDDMMPINGTHSARSGAVIAGGITSMTMQAQYPAAGTLSFDHETSCANGVDFLEFYVDGLLQGQWSGITPPANHNQPIAAGAHTFEWRFNRAGFINKGSDAVWVDDITLVGGVPQ